MEASFTADPASVFAFPDSADLGYNKMNNFQLLDYNNLTGFDNGSYALNGDLFNNSQALFPYKHDSLNNDMNNGFTNVVNSLNSVTNGLNVMMNGMNNAKNETINSGLNNNSGLNDSMSNTMNSTLTDETLKYFDNCYNTYYNPQSYSSVSQPETTQLNLSDIGSVDQFSNYNQSFKLQNFPETTLMEPVLNMNEVKSERSSNSPNYGYQQNFQFDNFNSYPYYGYSPLVQESTVPLMNNNYMNELNDSNYLSPNVDSSSNKGSVKDDLESVANASTCDNTPILHPATPKFSVNALSSNFNESINSLSNSPVNGVFGEVMNTSYTDLNGGNTDTFGDMTSLNLNNTLNTTMNTNGFTDMNNTFNTAFNGFNQDMSDTQLVNNGYYYPNYYQYFYNPSLNNYGTENGYESGYDNAHFEDSMNESILEIANEIANNVQYLPDKDSNGKYSLDKNHPIHCVWRDVNRGHCSWRCRWWENGKRLSKNFNVKRFGDFEAMRMAITMKIRNSTPVERIQLLKEQREAVRNQLQLYNYYPSNYNFNHLNNLSDKKITKVMNNNKKLQRENWNRLSWTYLKTNKLDNSANSTIICRLCSKTTRCSRSRNLQQAHIMHLIRMHKNPWKQYIDPNGLTKMCKLALDSLYEQNNLRDNQEWNLRPGIQRPEPYFL